MGERSTTPGSRRSLARSERTSAPTGRTRRGREGVPRVQDPGPGAGRGRGTGAVTRHGNSLPARGLSASNRSRACRCPVGQRGRRAGPRGRSTWPSASAPTGRSSSPPTGGGWTGTAPPASPAARPAARESARTSARTPCGTRSSPPRSMPGSRCATCRRRPPTPTRGPPRGTTAPGTSLDRHATYIIAAFIAGAAR
jgi:hypothetical protein